MYKQWQKYSKNIVKTTGITNNGRNKVNTLSKLQA